MYKIIIVKLLLNYKKNYALLYSYEILKRNLSSIVAIVTSIQK